MSQFTGRAKEIITIPPKPIPTGFKAWILADNGYFLSWAWHAKGDGSQGIGRIPRALGRNKTAAVVVYFSGTLPEAPPGTYSVTLDNLFISTKLVAYLRSKGFGARGTARINAGIYKDLLEIKKSDEKDIIPWGATHIRYVADGTVAQIGWKDPSYCLFMSNMDSVDDDNTVITKRRRPNETATCAKTARKPFEDLPEKDLPRPALTYLYNIEMNGVDKGDQKRAAYQIQQRQQKGWKAMFYTLIGIVVVDSYLLSSYAAVPKEDKFTKHLALREALYKALFTHATGAAAVGANETLPVAGPVNIPLPPGGSIPWINQDADGAAAENARTAYMLKVVSSKEVHFVCRLQEVQAAAIYV